MTNDKHEFLEDGEATQTAAWLSAQRQILGTALYHDKRRPFLERLVANILSAPTIDIPLFAGQRVVFNSRSTGQPLPFCCWRDGPNGRLSVLAAPLQQKGKNRTPHPIAIANDGQRVAIGWRTDCRDELDIQIMMLETGRVISAELPPFESHRTLLDFDLSGYWYMVNFEGSVQLLYKSLDDPSSTPVLVQNAIPADTPGKVYLMCFPKSKWLLIAIKNSQAPCTFDYYILSREPGCSLRVLWRDCPHKISFCVLEDRLFVLTNSEAPKMCVLRINLADSTEYKAESLIPEGPHPITSMYLAGEVLLLRTAVTPWTTQLKAYSLDGTAREIVGLPTDGTIEAVQGAVGSPYAYVEASGMCRRPSIHLLDTRTGNAAPYFQSFSRVTLPQVETVTTWYKSFDGTRVPIRISRRKDITPSHVPQPTILTTYGGFGVVDTMRYTNRSALWLALGGVYVHAGVRGGGELGADWHSAGRLHKKQDTFSDFVAAAEWLTEQGYTTPDKLAIVGGSNAGLVVAVAMTIRPDLFAAVVCSGPLLDMLRYHKFAGGDVGLPEFGSPENPEDEFILRRYSPYHNIQDGIAYPPVLFISGGSDTRCDPMHARKMVARMQDANPAKHRVLLDYRANKGHSGLMPLTDRIDTLTNQFVFLAITLGLHINQAGQFENYCKEAMTPD